MNFFDSLREEFKTDPEFADFVRHSLQDLDVDKMMGNDTRRYIDSTRVALPEPYCSMARAVEDMNKGDNSYMKEAFNLLNPMCLSLGLHNYSIKLESFGDIVYTTVSCCGRQIVIAISYKGWDWWENPYFRNTDYIGLLTRLIGETLLEKPK